MVVTGGCSGIGEQICLQLASRKGFTLIILDIMVEKGQQLVAHLNKSGSQSHFFFCDLEKPENIAQTMMTIMEKFKKIDIVINNAGIVSMKLFRELKMEEITKLTQINLLAPMQITQLALPVME